MIAEIIILILLVLTVVVLLKLLKGMLKIAMVALVVIGIGLVVFSLLFARDFNNVRSNIDNSSMLILLQNDGQITAGFETQGLSSADVTFFNSSQIRSIQTMITSNNMEGVLADRFRIIQITPIVFEPLENTITTENKAYKKEFLIKLLESHTPVDYYVEQMHSDMSGMNKKIIASTLGDPIELKSQFFALMFQKIYEQKGIVYILVEYKQDHVTVYPETISFKTIKRLPTSYAKDKFEDLVGSAKGKIVK